MKIVWNKKIFKKYFNFRNGGFYIELKKELFRNYYFLFYASVLIYAGNKINTVCKVVYFNIVRGCVKADHFYLLA